MLWVPDMKTSPGVTHPWIPLAQACLIAPNMLCDGFISYKITCECRKVHLNLREHATCKGSMSSKVITTYYEYQE